MQCQDQVQFCDHNIAYDIKVIQFSTLPSSFSSFWEMTTWRELEITRKPISQIRFCKKILIVDNFNC